MSIPNKQIGWSQESNLLWNISSQLDRLTKVIANLSPGGGGTNIYNSDGTLTANRQVDLQNNSLFFQGLNANFEVFIQTANNSINLTRFNPNSQITNYFTIGGNDSIILSTYNSPLNIFTELLLQNNIIKTRYQNNDIGLKLDFANNEYELGDVANQFSYYLDLNNKSFVIGDRNSSFNGLIFELNDTAQVIQTLGGGGINGLYINYNTSLYKYGQMTGGNGTTIEIDDVATYPVQIYGTNISSGTAGAASGQFLKIRVGGVDYKIALLNP